MKAGIYRTPNGNLIYVAKDRTIKATTLAPSSWPGTKVSHRAKDDTVLIANTDYRCTRWADVPNGCTDPAKYLVDCKAKNDAEIAEALGLSPEEAGLGDSPWVKGREDKKFSRQVVYGYGPGFLTEQMAAAERWLVQTTGQLDALVESGILSRVHDEYTVLDEVRYAAYLQDCFQVEPERLVGMPHVLGLGYGADAIDKDGNAVVFKTASTPGKTDNQQIDIYKQFARDIYGVTDADRERMRALGFRPCHKQSARKHRKAGHIVVGEGSGVYWWMKKAA